MVEQGAITVKVIITSIKAEVEEGFKIRFTSSDGRGVAIFVGNKPNLNTDYFVEVEINGTLKWQEDITKIEDNVSKFEEEGNLVSVSGILESVDNDGYTVIRIGTTIIALETEGVHPPIGSTVKVRPSELKLYDINL
jgi:hypothetical protein